jgi:putative addiction module component (TIGR02574 family)
VTRETHDVVDAALRLSTRERAEVIAKLIVSLDGEPDEDVEAAWAAEIERRARRVLAGEGEFEDWETIREQLRPGR